MMKLPITLLVLAVVGRAVVSEVSPASNSTKEKDVKKRELYEGNYGLRDGVAFGSKYKVSPSIEYVDGYADDSSDKASRQTLMYSTEKENFVRKHAGPHGCVKSINLHKSIFGARAPQIAKISDVLTGQGPPFEEALANHLYSPVSVYQARFSSPTIFDTPRSPQQDYSYYKLLNDRKANIKEQHEDKTQDYQTKTSESGYDFRNFLIQHYRNDSKLLHLQSTSPLLEPVYSTSGQSSNQDLLIQQQIPNNNFQIYPQYSFQQFERIPIEYQDRSLQPIKYVEQPLFELVPMQPRVIYDGYEEENTDYKNKENMEYQADQDYQPNEKSKVVQVSAPASEQEHKPKKRILTYATHYGIQPYSPGEQYLPIPQPTVQTSFNIEPQDQYHLRAVPLQTLEEQTVQDQKQINLHQHQQDEQQQYVQDEHQQYIQTEIEPVPGIKIQQSSQEADEQVQRLVQNHDQVQKHSTSLFKPDSVATIAPPQHTFKPISEFSTSPTLFLNSISTTTIGPHTHKPSRPLVAPLRNLSRLAPLSKPLPYPRPFRKTQTTMLTTTKYLPTLPPLPTFQRYSYSNAQQTTPIRQLSKLSTFVTSTTQPDSVDIHSIQSLPISTISVNRKSMTSIQQKPKYNEYQPTTTQPPQSKLTTLEPLVQSTTTFKPSTILESQSQLGSIQTQHSKSFTTEGPEYISDSEHPPTSQPEVLYHLQRAPSPELQPSLQHSETRKSQQSEPYPQPEKILVSPSPQLQPYLRLIQFQSTPVSYLQYVGFQSNPQTPPQSYQPSVIVQPTPLPEDQHFLRSDHFHLYEPPVFNLRPLYQPLPTPPSSEQLELFTRGKESQTKSAIKQQPSHPDSQDQLSQKANKHKAKPETRATYLSSGPILNTFQPILQPLRYSQSNRFLFQPNFHSISAPTHPTVQYFGKYAEAIFGPYDH